MQCSGSCNPAMWPALVGVLLLLLAVRCGAQWGEPMFEAGNDVDISLGAYQPDPLMQQNVWVLEEKTPGYVLVYLNYQGPEKPTFSQAPTELGPALAKDPDSDRWCITINRRLDYEVPDQRYQLILMFVDMPGRPYTFEVNLVNILDNAPVMASENNCEIEELRPNFVSDCLFSVFHADGFAENGIGNSSTNVLTFEIDEASGAGVHFRFVLSAETSANAAYTRLYQLEVLEALNYETRSLFNFVTTVYDLDRTHSFKMNTIVKVRNVESRPPRFTRPFATQRIPEKEEFRTTVAAIDGDTELNRPICYELTTANPNHQKYFEIGETSGELVVHPIDRDSEENELYPFTIMAYKCHNKTFNASIEGAIILEDKNDCFPEIDVQPLELLLWENTVMELPFEQFVVEDRDLGENARYDVRLSETVGDAGELPAVSFTIIPSSGYQRATFIVNILNASRLDYELPERQHFLLHVTAQEPLEPTHERTQAITLRLRNWNDEVPAFDQSDYASSVLETIGAGELLARVAVTDRDIDDGIDLTVLGRLAENVQVIALPAVEVEPGLPSYAFEIRTQVDEIFDYDVAKEVIVQLRAVDVLQSEKGEPVHQIFSQLTVTVIDVNNKPPQITLPRDSLHIVENSVAESPVLIGESDAAEIIGTDPDTEADLEFSIDWSRSYGTKSGVRAKPETYENCFYIAEEKVNRQRTIGTIRVNAEFPLQVDYEMYDTLFLMIRLVDRNQMLNQNWAEAVVAVQIDDVNDNAPYFDEDTLTVVRSVKERSDRGVTIGNIIAYDIDGPGNNEITFSMEPVDPAHEDWMDIDQNGIIRVAGDRTIDCDTPPIDAVQQLVRITDGVWTTSHVFEIVLLDTNNKIPFHEPLPDAGLVYQFEKIPSGTAIVRVEGTDIDRDVPYRTVSYEINFRDFPQLQRYFEVGGSTGLVAVKENNEPLDRDAGLESIMINVVMVDNAGGFDAQNRNATNINLILLDINDHYPELPALTAEDTELSEDAKQGFVIKADLAAVDRDDRTTPNAKVNYYIRQILPEVEVSLFVLENTNEYIATLRVGEDLKGYYGDWTVKIEACDRGSEYKPIIELPEPGKDNCRTREYELRVNPYNYNAPTITFPARNTQLRLKYESLYNGRPLNDTNGSTIRNFLAVDDDGGIFGDVTFSLRSTNDNEKDHEVFRVDKVDQKTGQLVLENALAVAPYPKNYSITVVAKDGGDRQAEAPINIVFIDMSGEPAFLEPTFDTDFTENEEGWDERRQLPFADDPKNAGLPPGAQTNVFYFIDKTYGNASHLFALDPVTNVLRLAVLLDREDIPAHELRVVATNNENGPPATVVGSSSALLVVRVKVNDVNDNPPVFQQRFYAAGITTNDRVQKPLFRVYAEDPDEDEVIRYEVVPGSAAAVGENLLADALPFRLDPDSGELTLTVKVQPNQKGYYQFTLIAFDRDDTHNDTVPAKVYIVSESNRVTFVFLNTVAEIDQPDVRDFLATQLSAAYEMECNIDDIDQTLEERQASSGTALTDVRTHFILDNQAVEASRIQQRSSNRTFVTELKATLRTRDLSLQDVPPTEELVAEADDTLQTILIVVAAALALLCVILFVAFLVKIRSLNRQLKALSATDFGSISSDMNGKPTRNVPTTNIFSIEGSNPVLNDNEFGRMGGGGAYDDLSIQSDESDFRDMDKDLFATSTTTTSRKESLNPAFLEHIRQRSLNPMANGKEEADHKKVDETEDELSHRF